MTGGANTVAALIRRTPSGKDGYGKVTYEQVVTILPGIFWPAGSSETLIQQDQVSTTAAICLPTGTDVSAIDAVIPQVLLGEDGEPDLDDDGNPQGVEYEVDGTVQAWPANPFTGWQPPFATVITLKDVSG